MDKVHKPGNSECHTPSSEFLRICRLLIKGNAWATILNNTQAMGIDSGAGGLDKNMSRLKGVNSYGCIMVEV
jgi:hypothetical protein